ncbi:MAG: anhydro-N-acetylmuramic acid kinase [Flavobacteriia bacterium]|jgi:anhydro-N-acetylmuramic acid kinase
MAVYEIIGLMSGTSLDGLDIAHVSFSMDANSGDSYHLMNCQTYDIPEDLRSKLSNAYNYSVPSICQLDKELGRFYADCVNDLIKKHGINKKNILAIASHGQTILHQPQNGFTLQIGCGSTLSYHTGIDVINDFRSLDIIAGGQGAPLVPVGDFGLFQNEAEAFLNIGGFTNVSFKKNEKILAFDICPGNLPLNKLALAKGLIYDKNGDLARSGEINFFLLDLLNSLDFYQKDGPKSLGTEWLEEHFYPLLKFDKEIENNLRTVVEHEAFQIGQKLNDAEVENVLITGGGSKNDFLISRIAHYFNGEIKLPSEDIIDFKEAIVFAYLGALYLEKRPNAISSVTGASKNMICGVFHRPGY